MRDDIPEHLRRAQRLLESLLAQATAAGRDVPGATGSSEPGPSEPGPSEPDASEPDASEPDASEPDASGSGPQAAEAPGPSEALQARSWIRAARRAQDRLERDLLPRTAGAHGHLVVGIVGPNNAGKSALFNSLTGRTLSPSLPRGGATRHLLGVCSPELAAALEGEPTLARFPLRRVEPGPEGVQEVTEAAGDAAELFLVELPDRSGGLLLIDTPDFDSVLVENRRASESLLKVCDLAVVVVTRHTYQNRDVVRFLEEWLAHERPWLLVYNESISDEVTREHAEKLAEDLGSEPVGVFHAEFDIEVQRAGAPLVPRALGGTDRVTTSEWRPAETLADWLTGHAESDELKARALEASAAELARDLRLVLEGLERESRLARELSDAVMERAGRLGRDVAMRAMPMAPFLEAFRAVLDRRPSLVSGGLRGFVRRSRLFVEDKLAKIRGGKSDPPASDGGPRAGDRRRDELRDVERAALEPAWPVFFEDLVVTCAPGGTFWQRAGRPEALDEALRASLESDLGASAGPAACQRAVAALGADPEVLREFQEACEEQIEAELDGHQGEWALQLAVDTVYLLPAMAAGFVIFQTGGLGLDIAIGGMGAVSTLLAERMSKLLGTNVARRARERWTELRGARLAEHLFRATLLASGAELERRRDGNGADVRALREAMENLTWSTLPKAT